MSLSINNNRNSYQSFPPPLVKAIGVLAIILAIGLQAGLGYGVYKFFHDVTFRCVVGVAVVGLAFFVLWLISLIQTIALIDYGRGMINRAEVTLPQPIKRVELVGDL